MDVQYSWIEFTFARPIVIRAYGLKSANDVPARAPRAWRLELIDSAGGLGRLLHEVTAADAIVWKYGAWETQIFFLSEAVAVENLKLTIEANGGDQHTQLGQFLLYE